MYLFELPKTYNTVCTYKSALSRPMELLGLPFKENKQIHDLLRAYRIDPSLRISSEPATWNMDMALHFLKGDKFEPLADADLRNLTRKTIFLLFSALGCRICELQALSSDIGWGDKNSSVSLRYVPEFLAKTESLTTPVRRNFTIKALSNVTKNKDYLRLCPVRALKYYTRRLKDKNYTSDRLFVAPTCPEKGKISKNAISYFVKEVICDSHKLAADTSKAELWKIGRVRPRDIRGYAHTKAYTMAGTITVINAAMTWRGTNTYTQFYFKKSAVYHKENDYFTLSPDAPLVMAQSIVSGSGGLLEPPGSEDVISPSVPTPSGSKEPKDTRSKVKSSSRSGPSKRSSSPALFSNPHKIGGGVVL